MEEERIQRVHQFLREYTEENAGYRITYVALKHHYFSWCRLIGLPPTAYGWMELYDVIYTRYPFPREEGLRALGVVGIRMKHPVRLPPY